MMALLSDICILSLLIRVGPSLTKLSESAHVVGKIRYTAKDGTIRFIFLAWASYRKE